MTKIINLSCMPQISNINLIYAHIHKKVKILKGKSENKRGKRKDGVTIH